MDVNIRLYERNGTPVGDISNATIRTLKRKLDGDEIEFELPYDHPLIGSVDLGQSEVGVFLDGAVDPYVHCVVWTDDGSGRDPMVKFTGRDLSSLLESRYVEDDLRFDGIDQHSIAWALIQHTQSQTDGDLNIDSGFTASGVLRDYSAVADEHSNIAKLLDAFRGIQKGFDWYIKVLGDGRREFRAEYPKRGSYDASQAFEWGKNISDYELKRDGRTYNDAIAMGDGDGPQRAVARHTDAAARSARGLSTYILPQQQSVTEEATLKDRAEGFVNKHKEPFREVSFDVIDHPDVPIVELEPGDERPVRIERGEYLITGDFLIVEIDINPYADTAKLVVEEL